MPAPAQPPTWQAQWAPIISASAVVLVGTIAAVVALRQWQTAHTKLQLDLYDKRLFVFKACKTFVREAMRDAGPSYQSQKTFNEATADARLLFDDYIANLVDQIERIASDLEMFGWPDADKKPEFATELEEQEAAYEAEMVRSNWASEQLAVIDEAFRPYLQIEKRRLRRRQLVIKRPLGLEAMLP